MNDFTRTKSAEVLLSMLREGTGRSFLDSGDAYGRHWQRNQTRLIEDEAPSNLSFRYGEISVEHRVYHWLRERLSFDEEASNAFDGPFREHVDPDDDKSWGELREEFPVWFARWRSSNDSAEQCGECDGETGTCSSCSGTGTVSGDGSLYTATGIYGEGDPITVNTYNEENLLDQTLLFTYFELRSGQGRGGRLESYVVLQIHGGCDVRGGYTRPRVFVVDDDEELAIFDYRRALIFCEGDPTHWWSTDDGQHWYAEGACGRGAGAQLETYERIIVDEPDDEPHAVRDAIVVLPDDAGRCPLCGHRLAASSR